jgi:hypothetical protein
MLLCIAQTHSDMLSSTRLSLEPLKRLVSLNECQSLATTGRSQRSRLHDAAWYCLLTLFTSSALANPSHRDGSNSCSLRRCREPDVPIPWTLEYLSP